MFVTPIQHATHMLVLASPTYFQNMYTLLELVLWCELHGEGYQLPNLVILPVGWSYQRIVKAGEGGMDPAKELAESIIQGHYAVVELEATLFMCVLIFLVILLVFNIFIEFCLWCFLFLYVFFWFVFELFVEFLCFFSILLCF
jgi:hypothetical protein